MQIIEYDISRGLIFISSVNHVEVCISCYYFLYLYSLQLHTLNKDPKYIFFDEATSALDANNERTIMENLDRFFEGLEPVAECGGESMFELLKRLLSW